MTQYLVHEDSYTRKERQSDNAVRGGGAESPGCLITDQPCGWKGGPFPESMPAKASFLPLLTATSTQDLEESDCRHQCL